MKQAVMTAPGKIEFRSAADPQPRPGQVLLRIRRIGVCGSDVHVFHGRHPYTSYPVVQGHEFSAVIETLGEGVTELSVGQKVTALPQLVCGTCPPCHRGDSHICDSLKVQGFQAPGVAGELFVADADKVIPLPESFSFEQGALVEPAAVAGHAVSRAGELTRRNVVVIGAGPIGNLTAQAARAAGAERVLIGDLSEYRLEVAGRCGIEQAFDANKQPLSQAVRRAFGQDGYDVAFDCAAAESALNAAIESINKGGRIVLVGVFARRPAIEAGLIQDHELTLIGTLMYRKQDYQQAAEAIAAGRIVTEPLISRHFDFEDYLQAYHFIDEAGPEAMKVFIDL